MKNKLIIIICVISIMNILLNLTNIYANAVPDVGISRPTKQEVYSGESLDYYITFTNADEINFTEKDVGKAGNGVTLDKKVEKVSESKEKTVYKVTLSNIQGPKDKLVSIAIRKGVAKNSHGVNSQSYKSVAFKIIEKEKPQEVVKPKPKPVLQPKPEVKPETVPNPVVKNEPQKKVQKKIVNIVEKKQEKNKLISETVNEMVSKKIKIDDLFLNKVSEGDTIKYVLHYPNEIKNINLSADKIETVGFTAQVKVKEFGNKRVVQLSNIKGDIGKNKHIAIKADPENEIKEITNTPNFEIVKKQPVDYSDIIEIPFTGVK